MDWIGTSGPLVLLPAGAASRWRGAMDGLVDYERLCDATPGERASVLGFPGGVALGIGTAGQQAAWWPSNNGGFVVVWNYADREEDVTRAMATAAAVRLPPRPLVWPLPAGGAVLAKATDPMDGPRLIALPPGAYRVSIGWHEPDPSTSLLLYGLQRESDPDDAS